MHLVTSFLHKVVRDMVPLTDLYCARALRGPECKAICTFSWSFWEDVLTLLMASRPLASAERLSAVPHLESFAPLGAC
jgi:hypothetical protein